MSAASNPISTRPLPESERAHDELVEKRYNGLISQAAGWRVSPCAGDCRKPPQSIDRLVCQLIKQASETLDGGCVGCISHQFHVLHAKSPRDCHLLLLICIQTGPDGVHWKDKATRSCPSRKPKGGPRSEALLLNIDKSGRALTNAISLAKQQGRISASPPKSTKNSSPPQDSTPLFRILDSTLPRLFILNLTRLSTTTVENAALPEALKAMKSVYNFVESKSLTHTRGKLNRFFIDPPQPPTGQTGIAPPANADYSIASGSVSASGSASGSASSASASTSTSLDTASAVHTLRQPLALSGAAASVAVVVSSTEVSTRITAAGGVLSAQVNAVTRVEGEVARNLTSLTFPPADASASGNSTAVSVGSGFTVRVTDIHMHSIRPSMLELNVAKFCCWLLDSLCPNFTKPSPQNPLRSKFWCDYRDELIPMLNLMFRTFGMLRPVKIQDGSIDEYLQCVFSNLKGKEDGWYQQLFSIPRDHSIAEPSPSSTVATPPSIASTAIHSTTSSTMDADASDGQDTNSEFASAPSTGGSIATYFHSQLSASNLREPNTPSPVLNSPIVDQDTALSAVSAFPCNSSHESMDSVPFGHATSVLGDSLNSGHMISSLPIGNQIQGSTPPLPISLHLNGSDVGQFPPFERNAVNSLPEMDQGALLSSTTTLKRHHPNETATPFLLEEPSPKRAMMAHASLSSSAVTTEFRPATETDWRVRMHMSITSNDPGSHFESDAYNSHSDSQTDQTQRIVDPSLISGAPIFPPSENDIVGIRQQQPNLYATSDRSSSPSQNPFGVAPQASDSHHFLHTDYSTTLSRVEQAHIFPHSNFCHQVDFDPPSIYFQPFFSTPPQHSSNSSDMSDSD